MALGDDKQAEPLLVAGYERLLTALTLPDQRVLDAANRLIELYDSTGRTERMEAIRQMLLSRSASSARNP
jgi:hypothetical protein